MPCYFFLSVQVKEGIVVTNKALIDKWMKDDNLAKYFLFNTCHEEQQRSLLTCDTARDIWVSIENQYQQNSIERRQALQQQFLNVTFNSEHGVRAHIEGIKLLAKDLTEAGCATDELSISNRILTTLPDQFLGFFTAWESTAMAERTLANLTTRLCNEEDRNKRRHVNVHNKDSDNNKALYGQPSHHSSSQYPAPSSSHHDASRVDAGPFNREAARFNSSPYPQRGGRGGRGRGNRGGFRGGNRGSGRRDSRFSSSNDGNKRRDGKCWNCNYYGHWQKECRFLKDDPEAYAAYLQGTDDRAIILDPSQPSVSMIAHAAQSSLSNHQASEVYLDSGATQHMFHQQSRFSNFKPIPSGGKSIEGIGNSRVEIRGIGDVTFNASVNGSTQLITFHNSLFAPELGINLISVGAITAKGAAIHFSGTKVHVNLNGVTILSGKRNSDATLYRLEETTETAQPACQSFRALSRSSHNSIEEWHLRLAHLNYPMMIKMSKSGAVDGFTLPAGTQPPIEHCHECAAAKAKRTPFYSSTSDRSSRIGQLIFSDVWGPAQVKSLGGALYCCTVRDDFSDFRVAYYLKTKDQVAGAILDFIRLLHTQTGQLVECVRTDGGKEYESNDFEQRLKKKGIRHETSVRHSPQQNGSAERDNRTLFEGTRALLHSNKSLPLSLWAEATNHKIYVLNRSISTTCPDVTPYEAWFKKKPNLSTLRAFGREFYVLIPKAIRAGKLEPVGNLVYFVGNSDTQKGERFYDPSTGKVNTSCDASPAHHVYAPRLPSVDLQKDTQVFPQLASQPKVHPNTDEQVTTIFQPPEDPRDDTVPTSPLIFPLSSQPESPSFPPPTKKGRLVRTRTALEEENLIDAPAVPDPRRSLRIKTPKVIKSMKAADGTKYATARSTENEVPDQYQDAVASKQAKEWMGATLKEYNSLQTTETYTEVDRPKDRSVIKTRWTYKLKPGFKGSPPIYKARFVAKGYTQEPDVDYTSSETYAPTLKVDSLRVLLSIAAVHDLELTQLDVKTAFLCGTLTEELYIELPEGFTKPGKVGRLNHPIYGLIQSAYNFNETFDGYIVKYELIRSNYDPCLYYHIGKDPNDITLFGIWVDDGILATKTLEKATAIIQHLEQYLEMTSRPADIFIGLEITRNREERKLYISQGTYVRLLLEKFRMTDCHPRNVPADPCSRLSARDRPQNSGKPPLTTTPYRAAVGGLMYVAKMTRPDALFAVNACSRQSIDPGVPHWEAIKWILAYLAGTIDFGICYGGTGITNHLVGYSDSDFAGCEDTRRSTSGLIFILNGGAISWTCHLQKPIALSTAEAEYYAAGHASKEIAWQRNLLEEIGFKQQEPTPLLCDNKSAIMMVHNPVFHARTKHIELKYHYIRKEFKQKNIRLLSVSSADELADFLTKPLKVEAL